MGRPRGEQPNAVALRQRACRARREAGRVDEGVGGSIGGGVSISGGSATDGGMNGSVGRGGGGGTVIGAMGATAGSRSGSGSGIIDSIDGIGGGDGDSDIGFYITQLNAMLRQLTMHQQQLHEQMQSATVLYGRQQLELQQESYQAQCAGNHVWFQQCHVRNHKLMHALQGHLFPLQAEDTSVTAKLGYVQQMFYVLQWLDQQEREFQQAPAPHHGEDASQPLTILEHALQQVCAIPGITTKPPARVPLHAAEGDGHIPETPEHGVGQLPEAPQFDLEEDSLPSPHACPNEAEKDDEARAASAASAGCIGPEDTAEAAVVVGEEVDGAMAAVQQQRAPEGSDEGGDPLAQPPFYVSGDAIPSDAFVGNSMTPTAAIATFHDAHNGADDDDADDEDDHEDGVEDDFMSKEDEDEYMCEDHDKNEEAGSEGTMMDTVLSGTKVSQVPTRTAPRSRPPPPTPTPCQQLLMSGLPPLGANLAVWSNFGTLSNRQLEIRQSNVKRVIGDYALGRGLFARREYVENEIITVYGGELITLEEAKRRKEAPESQSRRYLMRISDSDFFVDGWQFASGISDTPNGPDSCFEPLSEDATQWVQGCAPMANHNPQSPNAKLSFVSLLGRSEASRLYPRVPVLRANRDIQVGEEIVWNYGSSTMFVGGGGGGSGGSRSVPTVIGGGRLLDEDDDDDDDVEDDVEDGR